MGLVERLGWGGVNMLKRKRRKQRFFSKKRAKNAYLIRGLGGVTAPRLTEVFWFFFSKKNCFP
jgi:hypothetical protein